MPPTIHPPSSTPSPPASFVLRVTPSGESNQPSLTIRHALVHQPTTNGQPVDRTHQPLTSTERRIAAVHDESSSRARVDEARALAVHASPTLQQMSRIDEATMPVSLPLASSYSSSNFSSSSPPPFSPSSLSLPVSRPIVRRSAVPPAAAPTHRNTIETHPTPTNRTIEPNGHTQTHMSKRMEESNGSNSTHVRRSPLPPSSLRRRGHSLGSPIRRTLSPSASMPIARAASTSPIQNRSSATSRVSPQRFASSLSSSVSHSRTDNHTNTSTNAKPYLPRRFAPSLPSSSSPSSSHHRTSPGLSGGSSDPTSKLEHLLSQYTSSNVDPPHIAIPLGEPIPTGDDAPMTIAQLTHSRTRATPSTDAIGRIVSSDMSDAASPSLQVDVRRLENEVATLQVDLERAHTSILQHTSANTLLVQQYRNLEFENCHLHECLESRNHALAKYETTQREWERSIDSHLNKAAEEVQNEQHIQARLEQRIAELERDIADRDAQLADRDATYQRQIQQCDEEYERALQQQASSADRALHACSERYDRDLSERDGRFQIELQNRDTYLEQTLAMERQNSKTMFEKQRMENAEEMTKRIAELELAHAAALSARDAAHADAMRQLTAAKDGAHAVALKASDDAHDARLIEQLEELEQLKHQQFDLAVEQLQSSSNDIKSSLETQLSMLKHDFLKTQSSLTISNDELTKLRSRYESVTERLACEVGDGHILRNCLRQQIRLMSHNLETTRHEQHHQQQTNQTKIQAQTTNTPKSKSLAHLDPAHLRRAFIFYTWLNASAVASRTRPLATLSDRVDSFTRIVSRRLIRLQRFGWSAWREFIRLEFASQSRRILTEHKSKRLTLLVHHWRLHGITRFFVRWKCWIRDRCRLRREMLERVLQHFIIRTQRETFQIWKDQIEGQKFSNLQQRISQLQSRQLMTLIAKSRDSSQTLMFLRWRWMTRSHKLRKHSTLARVMERMTTQSIHSALQRWRYRIEQDKIQQLHHAINTHKQSNLRTRLAQHSWRISQPTFSAWRRFVRDKKAARENNLARATRHLNNLHLTAAWRVWTKVTRQSHLAKVQHQLVTSKQSHVLTLISKQRALNLLPIFHAWRHWSMSIRSRKFELLKRLVSNFERRSKHMAIITWQTHVRSMYQQQIDETLQTQLFDAKRMMILTKIRHYRHASLNHALLGWQRIVREKRLRKRTLLTNAIQRLERTLLWHGWKIWCNFIDRRREYDLRSHLTNLSQHLNLEKRKRAWNVIQMWRQRAIIQTFKRWAIYTRLNRQRKRELLSRCLTRQSRITLGVVWSRWTTYVSQFHISSLRTRLYQVHQLSQKQLNQQKEGFEIELQQQKEEFQRHMEGQIIQHTETQEGQHADFAREHATLVRQLHEQRLARLATLIRHWRSASIVSNFKAWRLYVHQRRGNKKSTIDKMVRRLARITLHQAWRQWTQWLDAARIEHARKELSLHKRARAMHMIQVWRSRTIVPVWHAWKSYSSHARLRKHHLLDMILGRLARNGLYRAFGQWKWYLTQSIRAEFTHRLHHQHAAMSDAILEQKRKRYTAMVARWQPKSKVLLFRAWRDTSKSLKLRKSQLIGRILGRLSNLKLFEAWRMWNIYVERCKAAHARVEERHTMMRLMEDERSLMESAHGELRAQMTTLKSKQVKHIIDLWRSRTSAPVFLAWRTYAHRTRARKKELLDKVLRRIGNLVLYGAWKRWSTFIADRQVADMRARFDSSHGALRAELHKHKHARIAVLVDKWRRASVAPTFLAWRSWSRATRARKHHIIDKFLHRLTHQQLWCAFRIWHQYTSAHHLAELKTSFATSHAKLGSEHASQMRYQKSLRIKHMIEMWRRRILTPMFGVWRRFTRENRKRKKILLDKVCRRLLHRELYLAFRSWHLWSESHVVDALRLKLTSEKSKRVSVIIDQWRRGTLLPTFQAWAAYAKRVKQERHELRQRKESILDQSLRRMVHSYKYRAWRIWHQYVADCRLISLHQVLSVTRASKVATIKSLIQRFTDHTLAQTFQAWRHTARKERLSRLESASNRHARLDKAIRQVEYGSLTSALRDWLTFVRSSQTIEWTRHIDQQQRITMEVRDENETLRKKLVEQIEITTYLYKCVHASI